MIYLLDFKETSEIKRIKMMLADLLLANIIFLYLNANLNIFSCIKSVKSV